VTLVMKILVFLLTLLALATPVLADEPTIDDFKAAVAALQAQRDAANNQIVNLNVDLARLKAENERLKKDKDAVK